MDFPTSINDVSQLTPGETEQAQTRIGQANEIVGMIFLQGLVLYRELGGIDKLGMSRADFLKTYVSSMTTAMAG